MADSKRTAKAQNARRPPPTTQQVGPGASGSGIIDILEGSLKIGYILTIGPALTAPNGANWPDPSTVIDHTEYWYFRKDKLAAIRAGTLTGLTLSSANLVPANSDPRSPTLQSNPLTVIPTYITPAANRAEWTTGQAPTFNPGTAPTTADDDFRLFANGGSTVCLGFKFTGSGKSLALANLFWATTTSANPPSFWFGTNPDAGSGTTQVDGAFASVPSYPASGAYLKKAMTLSPTSVPIGS